MLTGFLKHESRDYRRRALQALGKIGPAAKEAVPEILEMLKERATSDAAFDALGEIGPAASEALPALVKLVNNEDSPYRLKSLSTIERIRPSGPAMVKQIVKWMHDPSVSLHAERVWNVLGPEDIPSIKVLARSENSLERSMAVDKLCDLGQAAMPALIELLKGNDPDVRNRVLRGFGQMGPPAKAAVPAIAEILRDKDWQLRSTAAITLGQIGPGAKPAVAALTAALRDMDGDVRVCAIEALGRIGPDALPAVAAIIERLHDDCDPVRSAAVRSLGRIGPGAKAAVPELEKLRRDPVDYVRQAADEALAAISSDAKCR